MSKIDDRTRLRHMLDAAREARLFISGKTRESLDSERMLALSLVRLIEIIGEAASKVSREKQAATPQIQWAQIIAIGNRLIHAYFEIDLDIVWKTANEDLDPLVAELEKLLGE